MNEFKIDVEDNCLVLLSGGIGAATLLACLKKQNVEQVNALFFYYGDYVSNEKQCAEKLANYYGINLRVMDISNIYGNNMSVRYPVSFKQVDDFYIPYRNGVFVSVATAVAYYLRCSSVVWGTSSRTC
jgi:7-cyano-7-deazaguanine synthase in queuosine biosynthesis